MGKSKSYIYAEQHKRCCPSCKKEFEIPAGVSDDDWGYAYGGILCCTYRCMNALKRDDKEGKFKVYVRNRRGGTRKRLSSEEKARIMELYNSGVKIGDIVEAMQRSRTAVVRVLYGKY